MWTKGFPASATEEERLLLQLFLGATVLVFGRGSIALRRANQGLFVVLPRDQAPGVQEQRQRAKVVRVVTTIDYLLGD